MAKVEGADYQSNPILHGLLRPKEPGGSKKGGKTGKSLFRTLLGESRDDGVSELGLEMPDAEAASLPMDKLLDGVTQAGEDLKREPTVDRIKAYKASVRRFMSRIVADCYETEEKTSGTQFKKRKKYTLIRVVDAKLESLAAEILHHQRDQLEILRKLDEIRGLLVDLMQ